MQRQHSSQATSTLGNTPNLNIGFLHQKENPRPVLVIRHADTLICLVWCILVLTLRLAVYTLFGKNKIKFGQKFFTSPKTCTPLHFPTHLP